MSCLLYTSCPYTSALYTTHSRTEENPRVRLVFPLTRGVTPEEFVAVSRYLAQMLGIDYFDECSYQPNQLMYLSLIHISIKRDNQYKFVNAKLIFRIKLLICVCEWCDPARHRIS